MKYCYHLLSFVDSDGYEFMIVSLENKQWHFEAGDSQVRLSSVSQNIVFKRNHSMCLIISEVTYYKEQVIKAI